MITRTFPVNPMDLASVLSQYQDFVWLDSADESGFSLLAVGANDEFKWTQKDSLESLLKFFKTLDQAKNNDFSKDFPFEFAGGWLGYMAYEAYAANPQIPLKPNHYPRYPLFWFRHYSSFFYRKAGEKNLTFVSFDSKGMALLKEIEKKLSKLRSIPVFDRYPLTQLKSAQSFENYKNKFDRIKNSLNNGDYFELNYTQRFRGQLTTEPFNFYISVRERALSPMMAYMNFPTHQILSASPENFFHVKGNEIETFPIKGTRRRGETVKEDLSSKTSLLRSEKDKAELLMVTDMLRNDLGRLCLPGEVHVKSLLEAKTFPHYHHLLSHIWGKLKKDTRFSDLFQALFPGGSITGAPKVEVMRAINELEDSPRGVYTGALGFISDHGDMKFNIPIRTAVIQGTSVEFSTGGGIVVDSDAYEEYEECLIKAQVFSSFCNRQDSLFGLV